MGRYLWARGGARSSFAAEIVLCTIRGTPHSHLPLKCEQPRHYLLILLDLIGAGPLFDKATRPRHRPRRTRLRSTCLPGYRGAARSGRARGYYAHGVRDVIRLQARVRVPICIPALDISYTERRQVPRHWEERRAELGGPVHDPRLRATHRALATGTRMPVEDECHRRSW